VSPFLSIQISWGEHVRLVAPGCKRTSAWRVVVYEGRLRRIESEPRSFVDEVLDEQGVSSGMIEKVWCEAEITAAESLLGPYILSFSCRNNRSFVVVISYWVCEFRKRLKNPHRGALPPSVSRRAAK
jgi:hypothetical protein